MPAPWIFTFYSFKGGVGRSLAAINVAYKLASWGRHVLVIDMDLEAPGVSRFLERSGELEPPQAERQTDILTLLGELMAAHREGISPETAAASLPPITNYSRPVRADKLAPLAPKFGQLGHLDILGPDCNRNYSERLSTLGLNNLSHEELRAVSDLLRRYLKTQRISHRPFWLEAFQPSHSVPYDYVIIDSRTGFTEIGGLCIGPLADRLVVITGLNDQNVEGTRAFLEEVGISPISRSRDDKPWDENDEPGTVSGTLGPKPTIVVASPVPAGEIQAKGLRLEEIRLRLGVVPLQLSYHPQMALMESLFVRDYVDEPLSSQYHRLAVHIRELAGDGDERLAREISAPVAPGKVRDWSAVVDTAIRFAPASSDAPIALSFLADMLGLRPDPAGIPIHALLSQVEAARGVALHNWGNALAQQARMDTAENADRLFTAACTKYADAPPDADTLSNWGAALGDQARVHSGDAADELFLAACEKYARAVALRSDDGRALMNWGVTLSDQAQTKQGPLADSLYAAAYEKFSAALTHAPDRALVLNHWGDALSSQAKGKPDDDAGKLRAAASAMYTQARAAIRKPAKGRRQRRRAMYAYARVATVNPQETQNAKT